MINMFKVIINESSDHQELSIIDVNGINWINDFIGDSKAGQFTYDDEHNAYRCDQDTYDWWAKVTADHQSLDDRINRLKGVYGSDAVYEAIGNAGDCDLEDQPNAINSALDEAFPEGK